jgi:hypothetical protein
MKHPLVGVCRLVAEGGNQSPAGRQEDSLVAVLHYRQHILPWSYIEPRHQERSDILA